MNAKPARWEFRFNNGTVHVSADESEAAEIKRYLEPNETVVELFTQKPCTAPAQPTQAIRVVADDGTIKWYTADDVVTLLRQLKTQ
jgi:hypothetical protein